MKRLGSKQVEPRRSFRPARKNQVHSGTPNTPAPLSNVRRIRLELALVLCLVSTTSLFADVVLQPKRSFGLGELYSAALSPNGIHLATAGQSGAYLWDYQTGKVLYRLEGHGVPVTAIAFSPEGRYLVTGARDGSIRSWEAETGAPARKFLGQAREINSIAFAPDGRSFLSTSYDNSVQVWGLQTGESLQRLVAPGASITSAIFTPDGSGLVTAELSRTNAAVGLWDWASGKRLRSLGQLDQQVLALAFLRNGHLAMAKEDLKVVLWDPITDQPVRTLEGATQAIGFLLAPTHSSLVIAGCINGQVLVWDSSSGAILKTFKVDSLRGLEASSDASQLLISSGDNDIGIWDLPTASPIRVIRGHTTSTVLGLAFSPDERFVLSGGTEKPARLWNRTNEELVLTFDGQAAGTAAAAFSPDGTRVLTTIGFPQKAAQLWRTETGQLEREFLGHTDWLLAAVFSSDGKRIATAAQDRTARLWDSDTGKSIRTFTGHEGAVHSVALSPDGRLLATGGGSLDPTARLWEVESGLVREIFQANAGAVKVVSFSPSGSTLMVGWEDGLLRLYEVGSSRLVREMVLSTGFLNAAGFSPRGEFILTGEGWPVFTARLWDAGTGQPLRVFGGHTSPVNSVAFSPRGNRVLTGSDQVRLWEMGDLASRLQADRSPAGLELSWGLGQLQSGAGPGGPWHTLTNAVSPLSLRSDTPAAFFRVAIPQEE